MRYSHLRAFHHVALHNGFTRAAEVMGQSQPVLSDQVRRLEQTHDVLLFHRDRRQIRLTETGEALFRLTSRFFEIEDQIGTYLSESRAVPKARLRIAADSVHHVSDALARFRHDQPGAFVSVAIANSTDILARLRNYEAEIGVVGEIADAPDLVRHDLEGSEVIAIAAHGVVDGEPRAMTLARAAAHPLVLRETGSRTRTLVEQAARRAGVTLKPAIVVEGRDAMREIVATGAGIGFVSASEIGEDPRLARLPLADPGLRMVENLVILKARSDVPVIRAFLRSAGFA